MGRFDLHCHSIFSKDSCTPTEKLIARYVRLGFAGFALTDHQGIGGWRSVRSYLRAKRLDLEFISACEFKTERGDLIGLYLEEMIPSRDPLEVIDAIHAQGGLAILPHPFDFLRGPSAMSPDRLGSEGCARLDGIEALNARAGASANARAAAFGAERRLAITGGSDAHFLFEAGAAWTQAPDGMELATAIRKRKTRAGGSRSPFYVHGPTTLVQFGKRLGLLPRLPSSGPGV